jgi:MFS family permease
MLIQTGMMVYLALLPAAASLWLVGFAIASHGLGAGLSLAALHRAAMTRVSERQTGVAAGLYSMLRFGGSLFGTALGGVVLQSGLDRQLIPFEAYQIVFWFIAGVALIGTLMGFGLRE